MTPGSYGVCPPTTQCSLALLTFSCTSHDRAQGARCLADPPHLWERPAISHEELDVSRIGADCHHSQPSCTLLCLCCACGDPSRPYMQLACLHTRIHCEYRIFPSRHALNIMTCGLLHGESTYQPSSPPPHCTACRTADLQHLAEAATEAFASKTYVTVAHQNLELLKPSENCVEKPSRPSPSHRSPNRASPHLLYTLRSENTHPATCTDNTHGITLHHMQLHPNGCRL